jgi:shikimate kinase
LKSICLIGFMGSGKSTLGKALADKLGIAFFDTDQELEKWRNKKIPMIFQEEGEEKFRDYESETLRKMPRENAVIATGGGIIEKVENRKWLKQHFDVIYLNPSFETISDRLKADHNRPLWKQDDEQKLKLYASRKSLYQMSAKLTVDIGKQSPDELVDFIINSIQLK